ncbi:MAG: helix-turn-helix domain-containing protein [Solirubrobacterales bacterium]|nr:helix-turn-helix domain-containing protein [Solirubrobacterales bacterium]
MPEIGATLREARMRARIDISEIEAETKIRAKYLRALENEEWDLLPGPAYVRSFLRTYADALDLDSKLLLEEYKLRHERPSDQDLLPISPRRQRARPPRRGMPRGVVVGLVVVALLAALYALGRDSGDEDGGQPANTIVTETTRTTTTKRSSSSSSKKKSTKKKAAASRIVRLQILPKGPVFVCLQDASGKQRISATLQQSATQPTFRSRRFRITLGNGNVQLRIDRKLREVPEVSSGIGYEITKKSVRRLSPQERPSCAR